MFISREAQAHWRLGVSEQTALAALTPALKRFQRTHSDIELKLTVAPPSKLEFLLTQGELDFVISDPARIASQSWNRDLV